MITMTAAQTTLWPTNGWTTAAPADVGMDVTKLDEAKAYALQGGGSGYVTRFGKLVYKWGSETQKYDVKSATKSVGFTTVGLAIKDGLMNLHDKAQTHHPTFGTPPSSNTGTGWLDDITIEHLATQTAGFDKNGGYTALLFTPGTHYYYSDGGPNWLAECVTLMFDRVLTTLGLTSSDLHWRNNSYRDNYIDGIERHEFGAGVHANVDAMTRIGYLYLRNGEWDGQQILTPQFVDTVHSPPSFMDTITDYTGNCCGQGTWYAHLWWHNLDGHFADVPKDAYWAWGMWGNHIFVVPSLDIVAVRVAHNYLPDRDPEPFFTAIVKSVTPVSVGPGQQEFSGKDLERDIFTNPGLKNLLNMGSRSGLIKIFDINGRRINTYNMNSYRMDDLKSGTYIISYEYYGRPAVKKVILTK
jgi:CubicO group peptidase (beta-lactamase class C family)